MKKIIDGKLYNTDTAKKVAEWSSNDPVNDNAHFNEELYRKRTGEYFIYGSGNAGSKYAKAYDGAWMAGEDIVPLTLEQAQDYTNKNLDADDYQKIFGAVSEGDDLKAIHIQVDAKLYDQLKAEATSKGISMRALLTDIIKGHEDNHA